MSKRDMIKKIKEKLRKERDKLTEARADKRRFAAAGIIWHLQNIAKLYIT